MNLELIEKVIATGSKELIEELLEDEETVFYVDWREEDEYIISYCEDVLQTGSLKPEVVETDDENGWKLYIHYRGKRGRVPLTYSGRDRMVTILALNAFLKPDFEIRACVEDFGDTMVFLPLPITKWKELKSRYGDKVKARFECPTIKDISLYE